MTNSPMLGARALYRRDRHRAGTRKHCRCGDKRGGSRRQEIRRARRTEERRWRRQDT